MKLPIKSLKRSGRFVLPISLILIFYILLLRSKPALVEKESEHVALTKEVTHQHTLNRLPNLNLNLGNSCDPNQQSLLTLFTTFHDVESRRQIQNNTIRNWSLLKNGTRVIIYIDTGQQGSELIKLAHQLNWCVEIVPLYRKELPVLRSLFIETVSKYQSQFYAFANSDILFDYTMIETVNTIGRKKFSDIYTNTGLLVIGKRTNVDMEVVRDTHHPNDVKDLQKKGTLFLSVAQDYFITTATGYPWNRIPDLVVGRPGFDNYFLIKALEWNLTVIDATDTLTAVHQTGNDGNQASFRTSDKCMNKNLVAPFDYSKGSALCAQYFTTKTITGDIAIGKRWWFPEKCLKLSGTEPWVCKE